MLSRSQKTLSLLAALGALLSGMAILAGPAMAFSLNPDAGSPGVSEANDLHTILFIVVLIAIVVVNLAILRAARPRQRHVASSGEKRSSPLKVGLVLSVIAVAIFVTATVFSDKAREVPVSSQTVAGLSEDKQLEINATGQQWLWRFNYPNGAFSYHRLVVPAGVTVALRLDSIDVIHGWNVPSLTGKADAVPGQSNRVYFRADEEGVHNGRSSILSGQGYDTMEAEVEVVSPADYEAYVERLKTDIQTAQTSAERTIATGDVE